MAMDGIQWELSSTCPKDVEKLIWMSFDLYKFVKRIVARILTQVRT